MIQGCMPKNRKTRKIRSSVGLVLETSVSVAKALDAERTRPRPATAAVRPSSLEEERSLSLL